ncbi:MAG: GNAT family N-acetyltransferase [Dehalococcoidia bacterium]|nr:GNAT family N-acetyltransferase [Dehalococcoidia bacterium]
MPPKSPLEGELIRLRSHEPEDEPYFHRWIHDPEVTEHLNARYPYSHAQEREFASLTSTYQNATFSVVTLAEGQLIGNVSLRNAVPEDRSCDLGIMIGDKEYWGRGYGTDTMRTACRFGFEMMNLHRIELEVFAGNDRAQHVYEKVGFKVEARRRQAHFKFGRYVDVLVMGLLEGELR